MDYRYLIVAGALLAASLFAVILVPEPGVQSGQESAVEAPLNSGVALTVDEVALHNSPADCWLLIDGVVYDVTSYIRDHPGGAGEITRGCGIDASVLYATQGGEGSHSQAARSLLGQYRIGSLGEESGSISITESPAGSWEDYIAEHFAGARVLEQDVEDDGRVEVHIIYLGDELELKFAADGSLLEVED